MMIDAQQIIGLIEKKKKKEEIDEREYECCIDSFFMREGKMKKRKSEIVNKYVKYSEGVFSLAVYLFKGAYFFPH